MILSLTLKMGSLEMFSLMRGRRPRKIATHLLKYMRFGYYGNNDHCILTYLSKEIIVNHNCRHS